MTTIKTAAHQPFSIRPLVVEVVSETNPNESYLVQLPHCTCLDFRHRDLPGKKHICKRIRAVLREWASWHGLPAEEAEEVFGEVAA